MRGLLSVLFLCWYVILSAQHSNEFYIDGAHVTIQSGAKLHIQGDFLLDEGVSGEKGRFNNDGTLELRGNFYLKSDNAEQTDGTAPGLPGTSTGIVRFKNRGYTIETIHQNENQSFILSGASDMSGSRAFYKVELQNDNATSALPNDNFIDINGGDVEIKASLSFTNCRIRTDNASSSSTPPRGSDYSHRLIISNTSPASLIGYSTTAGDIKNYIEGKLSRNVAGTANYYFPIGLEPGFAGADGMASFELRATGAASQRINSYLSNGQTALAVPQIYCDIGDYPNAGSGTQPWSNCDGGPDGLYDFAHLDVEISHEWVVENEGADFTYDLELYPGSGLDDTAPTVGSTCGAPFHLRFVAKDGALMSGSSIGPVISAPLPFSSSNFPIGYDLCPPATKQQGNVITGQNSFSTFRIHGATNTETALPVELVSLDAYGVDSRYIQVDWNTASEINNAGFELERSTDGVRFQFVSWTEGHGTTAFPRNYGFADDDVVAGVTYYYRLKQVDLDGTFSYSSIVDARLEDVQADEMTLFPNPVSDVTPVVQYFAAKDFEAGLFIVNAVGQEVKREKLFFNRGFNRIDLPTDALAAGTYWVSIFWDEGRLTKKLIILRNR